MIKKLIVFASIFFSTLSWAQDNTASPYSYYGLGEVKFRGTQDARAMGGLSVVADSLQLNLLNPASFSRLKLTTFAVGGTSTFSEFNTASESEKAQRTSLDYIAVGFPVGKFGFSFGLMPYSAVGYKIENTVTQSSDNTERNYLKTGDGNINRAFISSSYAINKNLSFGLEFGYNFGEINNQFVESIYSPIVLQLRSREKNNSEISGISFNAGFLYNKKITSKLDLFTSLTYSPEANLNSQNGRNLATIIYNINGTELVSDNEDIEVADTTLKIPSKFSFGAGIGESKKWLIGTELTFVNNSQMTNRFGSLANVSFENSTKFAIGGYYIPKYDSFSSYFSRIVYRAGFRHENTGLVINNESIKDYAMTLGFGFPIGVSKINLGLEYGKRGTTTNGLIEENYFNLNIGLSLSDLWFKKRKID